eukprot:140536-Amorphochlora_amoeboformis.AAC.1
MGLFERIAVIDPKTSVCATGKTPIVLIEANEEKLVGWLILQVHPKLPATTPIARPPFLLSDEFSPINFSASFP